MSSESEQALNADIVEKGVVFKKNPAPREPHKRMTKQEIHDFVNL